jgi:hypothetical protein
MCIGGAIDGLGGPYQDIVSILNLNTSTLVTLKKTFLRMSYYPYVHVLPYVPRNTPQGTYHFTFVAGDYIRIVQLNPNNSLSLVQSGPMWPFWDTKYPFWLAQGSAAGTATLLMLKPENKYAAELVTFGGNRKIRAGETLTGKCICNEPASPWSLRIKLDPASTASPNWSWAMERMPGPRTGVDCVVMPNGQVYLFNGAGAGQIAGGYAGGSQAGDPVYNAW